MKYRILPIILIAVLIVNGCSQNATPTSTQMPIPSLRVATETATIESPTASPTTTPEQDYVTFQCLEIQPSIPNDFKSANSIVLKDYFDNRSLFALQATSNSSTTIFRKDVLYPFISPNGKLLAYLDISDVDAPKLILVNIKNEIQATIPWLDDWGLLVGWINDNQLAISPYSREHIVIFNPFTAELKNIGFDQFPEFNFILNLPWAEYNPNLDRVIYPKGSQVLFDVESKHTLAEIPEGISRPPDASWTRDGNFAAIIGSVFPLTDNVSDELFVVSRDGVVEQVTHLSNFYDHVTLNLPRWSPDGKHIAFWETDSRHKYQDRRLFVADLSTKQVTNYCISTYQEIYGNFGEALPAPIWSSNGTQILVENRYSEDHNKVILIDILKNIAIQIAQDARPIGWMTPQ